jgi:hypothetical protein
MEPLVDAERFDALRQRTADRLNRLSAHAERGEIQVTPEFGGKVLRHLSGVLHALEACVVVPMAVSSSGQ